MVKTTRAQREALARILCRDHDPNYDRKSWLMDYKKLRKTVQPYLGDTCIMVPRWGMWLGIETDGHTHS